MEQIKIYWDQLKTKMDEDPVIKKAAICAIGVLVMMWPFEISCVLLHDFIANVQYLKGQRAALRGGL